MNVLAVLPDGKEQVFLTYTGMETDLIFTQGIALKEFASFPLLESSSGRAALGRYYKDLMELGRSTGLGVVLEAPTWMANRDRAAPLGYDAAQLRAINIDAIGFVDTLRAQRGSDGIFISANIGPRDDAYAPSEQMRAQSAQRYHLAQMEALAQTRVDMVTGYTLAYAAEAIGIVTAARKFHLPVVISLTVETDGRLPSGETLREVVERVDEATESYAQYYMINCAHPDHFLDRLEVAPWMARIKGIVANASRCSHAELDNATELDDGDPKELASQLAQLRQQFPQLRVLGGCCGTDMRHMGHLAQALVAQRG